MKIVISPRAEKYFRGLGKVEQIILAKKIRSLAEQKDIKNAEKLKGYKNNLRVRVGDYRIVYKRTSKLIYIVLIGQRKDIYESLKRLLK